MLIVSVRVVADVEDFVQWGTDYNMRRLITSYADSTPAGNIINLQGSQTGLDLGLGVAGSDDSRHYITLGWAHNATTPLSGNPFTAGLIDSGGDDLKPRDFYFAHEQLRGDATGSSGNRRIGPTSSYSTGADWRSSAAEQYCMYVWPLSLMLSSRKPSFTDPDSKLEVRIRMLTNLGDGSGVRFVVKNGDKWYYSEENTTSTGVFTLEDPGSANWAEFYPESLSTTARALAVPSSGTFDTVDFDDIQYVGFISETDWASNTESRQGFDNFIFEGSAADPLIENDIPTDITVEEARLNASLISTGDAPTAVWVFWGDSDEGTNKTLWANTNYFGFKDVGTLSTNISGLTADSTYYYRFYATNAYDAVWAAETASFNTSKDWSDWSTRMKVQFPLYDRAETLDDFPALVVLSESIPGFSYDDFSSEDGDDLRFADEYGTQELKYEIDEWNTNGSSYVWVQVPELTSNTVIWAYYGNATATQQVYTTNGTLWSDCGYLGVWHLGEGETDPDYTDASTNGFDGTVVYDDFFGTAPASSAAVIGSGVDFPGVEEYFYLDGTGVSADFLPAANSPVTLSAWVKADIIGGDSLDRRIITLHDSDPGAALSLALGSNNKVELYHNDGSGGTLTSSTNVSTETWIYAAGTYDGTTFRLYVDGLPSGNEDDGLNAGHASRTVYMASDDGSGSLFDGILDEIRIASVARSSNYIWASYMNQKQPDDFSAYTVALPAVETVTPTNISSSSFALRGQVTFAGFAENPDAYVCWGASDAGNTDTGLWDTVVSAGTAASGTVFEITAGGLSANSVYYYRCYVTNSAGAGWSDVQLFNTYSVTVAATIPDASRIDPGTDGEFTVYRNENSGTNLALTVNYTISGTASNGVDYVSLSGSVDIPVGATTAEIVITPYSNVTVTASRDVTLTLTDGAYVIGAQYSDTVTIAPDAAPYSMQITFSGYDPGATRATLTNFPALVTLSTNLTGFAYERLLSPADGADLRFWSGDGLTELAYELDTWDTNGTSLIWVRVPELSGTNTVVIATWGRVDMSDQPSYVTDGTVWSEDFNAVWHLDGVADATANSKDGTNSGTTDSAGLLGRARDFDGASYVDVPDNVITPAQGTISLWANVGVMNNSQLFASFWKMRYYISLEGGVVQSRLGANPANLFGTAEPGLGEWFNVSVSYISDTSGDIYFNGQHAGSWDLPAELTEPTGVNIGSYNEGHNGWFTGLIDEVRVAGAERSADWIWAEYMTVASNAVLAEYADVAYGGNNPIIANLAATNITSVAALFKGELLYDGGEAPAVTLYWGQGDGGTNAAGWANTNVFSGTHSEGVVSTNISGLDMATTYYYRFYAENGNGSGWAAPVASFTTLGPLSVTNHAATDITTSSATANGELLAEGPAQPSVYLYWGTTDGVDSTGAWANVEDFGVRSIGTISTNLTGLTGGETYYYRFYATSAVNQAWAPESSTFVITGTPRIRNAAVSDVEETSATLNGYLISTGNVATTVTVYWGLSDGGDDASAWANTNEIGQSAAGAVSDGISSLSGLTVYYYRFYATNEYGGVWASSTTNFATGGIHYWSGLGADTAWETDANWTAGFVPYDDGASDVRIGDFSSSGRELYMNDDHDIYRLDIGDGTQINPVVTVYGEGNTLTLRKSGIDNASPTFLSRLHDNGGMDFYPNIRFNAGVGSGEYVAHFQENNNANGPIRLYGSVTEAPGESWTVHWRRNSHRGGVTFYNQNNNVSAFRTTSAGMGFVGQGSVGDALLIFAGGQFAFSGDFYTTPLSGGILFESNGSLDGTIRVTGVVTQSNYTLTAAGNNLLRMEPSVIDASGPTIVSDGLLSVPNMSAISPGYLSLAGGAFVLGSGDVPTVAEFAAARNYNASGGAGTWRISSGFSGFAARNSDIVLGSGWAGIDATTFDNVRFCMGSTVTLDGIGYATNSVTIGQNITLSDLSGNHYLWRFIGQLGSDGSAGLDGFWRLGGAVHEFAGDITGGSTNTRWALQGVEDGTGSNRGGIIRLSGDNTGLILSTNYVGTSRGIANSPDYDQSGLVVIFRGVNSIPDAGEITVFGGGSARNMLLFEDSTGGETFSRSFIVGSGGASGFGSYSGDVVYNGTVTNSGTGARLAIMVHDGTLTLDGATISRNDAVVRRYVKSGPGELILPLSFIPNLNPDNGTFAVSLLEGTLTTVNDAGDGLGRLTDSAAVDWGNIFNSSPGGDFGVLLRTWQITTADQTYTMANGQFLNLAEILVNDGLTLTTDTGRLSPAAGNAVLRKTGTGTWVYTNALALSTSGSEGGLIEIAEGTLVAIGDMGRSGLRLAGGTLLSGETSSFTGRDLFITSDGGTIGLASSVAGDVTRSGAVTGWDQSAPSTLTLQARGNHSLVFEGGMPDVVAGTTVVITNAGAGSGVVRVDNASWNFGGTLTGDGTLQLQSDNSGTLNLSGATIEAASAGVVGTLTVNGNVGMSSATELNIDIDLPDEADKLVIDGDLTLDGVLNITDIGATPGTGTNTFTIITYTGSLTDNGLEAGTIVGDYLIDEVITSVPGEIQIKLIAYPTVPRIYNTGGATNVTGATVTLQGDLVSTGGLATTVFVFWGESDEGTSSNDWISAGGSVAALGQKAEGALSYEASVTGDTQYYYRFQAVNSQGSHWGDPAEAFVTGEITITTTNATAYEEGEIAGSFTVSRPAAMIAEDLTVYYTVSGTAVAGTDYTALTGSVTIAAGDQDAEIYVEPIDNSIMDDDGRTVIVTLSPGGYVVGSPDSATVTITDNDGSTAAWQYRLPITFGGYTGEETLTNFPALVVLSEALDGFDYDQVAHAEGYDLRFLSSGGEILPYEIEEWDTGSNSYIWVRVPELSGTDTALQVMWGNAQTEQAAYTTNGAVWFEGFEAVWHLNETGTDIRVDASGNNGDSTAMDAAWYPTDISGAAGGADHFDGSEDRLLTAFSYDPASSDMTWGGWYNIDELPSVGGNNLIALQQEDGTGSAGRSLISAQANNDQWSNWFGGAGRNSDRSVLADRWQHVVFVYNDTANTYQWYVDGVAGDSGSVTAEFSDGIWKMGVNKPDNRFFPGGIDEVRVASVQRSSDWVQAEYLNMASNDIFNSYGAVELYGLASVTNVAISNITVDAATFYGELTSTGRSETVVHVYWGTTDGETNRLAWDAWGSLGAAASTGVLSTNVSLGAGGTFYFRFYATNAAGEAWAADSFAFQKSEVTVSATVSSVAETGPGTAEFTVSRGAADTSEPMTVNYTVGGTATAGTDYEALSGSVVIESGQATATIDVTPIHNEIYGQGTRTVQLTLASGGYVIGTPGSASVSITEVDNFDSWIYSMPITISGYSGSETLTNFPVLVKLDSSIENFSYDGFRSPTGGDLRFASSDKTTALAHEIEDWNISGTSYIWVRIPELSGTDTEIWAFWGNNTQKTHPVYTTNGTVWSAGYAGVWHLAETSGTHLDSTANEFDGTAAGGVTQDATGMIDGADEFDGVDGKVTAGSTAISLTNTLSFEAWVYPETLTDAHVFSQDNVAYTDQGYSMSLNGIGGVIVRLGNGTAATTIQSPSDLVTAGQWNHVGFTYDGTTPVFYVDGAGYTGSTVALTLDIESTRPVTLGAGFSGDTYPQNRYLEGTLDEVRISNIIRSADWMRAVKDVTADNAGFMDYGTIEGTESPAGTIFMFR